MIRRFRWLFLAMVMCLPLSWTEAALPVLPAFPKLEFRPPRPERFVLENGLVVFLLEDHELPLIRMNLVVRAGSQYEAPNKVGLGSIFGEALTKGGTTSRSPEDIEKLLDRRAASISFGVGLEQTSGAMSCRTNDLDEVFGLFTDLVLHPRFRKDHVELPKAKALEELRRLNDDPEDVARREFRRALYGKDHPYARIPSPASLKSIRRDDLLAWHQFYFHPNMTFLAVSGDFRSAVMKDKIQKAFGSWPRTDVVLPVVANVPPATDARLFYIQKPLNQSQIRIGSLGLARHSPDHFAWEVFNELWGGSAASRLFRTVRTQQGLAYSVGSAFSEPTLPGLVVAICQTRGRETVAAAQSILAISSETRHAPFTAAEIQNAKEAIQNRFIENYTSSAQIAAEVMNFEFFGFPPDYLDTYPKRIAAVSAADLRRVGKTYLHPDRSTILIMGDLSLFSKPISTLGKPREIKLQDYSKEEL